jgi:hypothetical protein
VVGVAVEVESTEAAAALQGDLFDVGFATASAVEAAVARLLEDQGEVIREPAASGHPLAEQRGDYRLWVYAKPRACSGRIVAGWRNTAGDTGAPDDHSCRMSRSA